MDFIRPTRTATAIVMAAAGLAVATPLTESAAGFRNADITLTASWIADVGTADALDLPDPFGIMQQVLEDAQRQISDGFEYLTAGELGLGVGLTAAGFANSFVYAPLASFLTVVAGTLGQPLSWLSLPDDYFLGFSDINGLFAQVDDLVTGAFDRLSLAFEELADGQISYGLSGIFYTVTNLIPDIPLQLVVGSAILLEDMLGLYA